MTFVENYCLVLGSNLIQSEIGFIDQVVFDTNWCLFYVNRRLNARNRLEKCMPAPRI